MELYPLKFQPIYKEKVWGGRNLSASLKKELPKEILVGESWELCAHAEGTSVISNGLFQGKKILEVIKEYGEEILGVHHQVYKDKFPLLIKFIDANDKLSVQVHPDDRYATEKEGELGKTEMWYIIDARPRSKLVYGLIDNVDNNTFKKAIKENKIKETLHEVEVNPGDVFFIPAGMVHAVGEGIVLAEIQQNSDTTYRVYDWGRQGLDGKPRALHIEKALEVIDFSRRSSNTEMEQSEIIKDGYSHKTCISCPYFSVELLDIHRNYVRNFFNNNFEILIGVDGEFVINYGNGKKEKLSLGETVMIPAQLEVYEIIGRGKVLRIYIATPQYQEMIIEGIEEVAVGHKE